MVSEEMHLNDFLEEHGIESLESDLGAGRPIGFAWNAGPSAEPLVREIAGLLQPLGGNNVSSTGAGGADISRLVLAGVPLFASVDVSLDALLATR